MLDIIKKNNNNLKNENINYDDFDEDYVPGYSKQKKETTVDNINEDINMESNNEIATNLLQKRPIKREVKVVENDNNNLNTNSINLSGIKRIVKQEEEISADNNNFSRSYQKSNFTRTVKEINKNDNIDSNNNNFTYMSFNKTKYKLPVEKDNSIKIFWYDAIEENFNNIREVYNSNTMLDNLDKEITRGLERLNNKRLFPDTKNIEISTTNTVEKKILKNQMIVQM